MEINPLSYSSRASPWFSCVKLNCWALASVAWLVGASSRTPEGCVLTPSQGTYLIAGSVPGEGMCQRQLINVSLLH